MTDSPETGPPRTRADSRRDARVAASAAGDAACDPRPLDGQNALVTGSSGGLGAACARSLARAGATVGVTYHGSEDGARAVTDDIEAAGGRAVTMRVDVADEGSVCAMFDAFAEAAGELDVLVANAGIQKDATLVDMTLDDWNAVLNINLTGQFLCVREAVRRFDARTSDRGSRARGKIVCMSSVHELIPWAGHVNYAASKGGIMMMMKSVAQEVACRGIRVNGVAPGAIATAINERARDTPEELEAMLKLIPYDRVGDPEDVANAVLWLASDASDYVVGTTLFVDGGMSLYPSFRDGG